MDCFFCKTDAGKVGTDTKAVLCGACVQKLTGAPEIKDPTPKLSFAERSAKKAERVARKAERLQKLKTAKRGRGRGWHLKKLFEFDGEYFSMGEKITPDQAAKIRKALAASTPALPIPTKKRGRPKKVQA